MEQSIEIRNLILRYYEMWMDISFNENLLSQKDGVLVIGTDPNEWWADNKTIISGLKSAIAGMSGVSIMDVETKAYSEGTVGWSSSRMIMKMPDASEVPARLTCVFHQENGDWKIVQYHISIGVSNEEALGITT